MNRRNFLAAGATALGASQLKLAAQPQAKSVETEREYYELRHYRVQSGRQQKITDAFLKEALVPAVTRLGIGPVGVFNVDIGESSPGFYVLLPAKTVDALATLEARLGQDDGYLKVGAPFLTAPADQPALIRIESSLMVAFQGWPRLKLPAASTARQERLFELRTYESPSDQDHRRKVEMFNSGEFDVFERAGFWQVFFGDVLIGAKLPCLTYMIGFPTLADRVNYWKTFGSLPEWKKLTSSPRFSFESIVSNITNIILRPTDYSQI
ncbi:MAG TPA: NIPSNAP family protein [Candidatus Acidoferrum sp.]|nr:NIPSNAP family protein [Candidatus Acidoferrum sp.]